MKELIREFLREKEYGDFELALKAKVGRTKPLMVAGLCEAAEAVFIETLLHDLPDGKKGMAVLVPDERRQRKLCDYFATVGVRVYSYLYRDPVLHNMTGSHDFEYEHLRVLSAILAGEYDLILATPAAAMQYTIPEKRLRDACFTIGVGDRVSQDELTRRLTDAGYYRCDLVDGPGQFSVRGGIVDIYSPAESEPIRVDYFDDEIDRMCGFDIMTQRQTENRDSFTLSPCREVLITGEDRAAVRAAISQKWKAASEPSVKEQLGGELAILDGGGELSCADKYISLVYPEKCCLLDYLSDAQLLVSEYSSILEAQKSSDSHLALTVTGLIESGELAGKYADFSKTAEDLLEYMVAGKTVLTSNFAAGIRDRVLTGLFTFRTRATAMYAGNAELLRDDLRDYLAGGYRVHLMTGSETEAENLKKMLSEQGFPVWTARDGAIQPNGTARILSGNAYGGFDLPEGKYALLSLVGAPAAKSRYIRRHAAAKKDKNLQKILSYADLSVGDYVVHEIHGIGQYLGMSSLTVDGARKDFIKVQYAGTDALYLPCGQLDKISKYIGAGEGGNVKLSKMGGTEWAKTKLRAKTAAKEMAKELIALYAERLRRPGFAFDKDDAMMRDFEAAFPYEETDGQLAAIEDVKQDMMKKYPMDRILCGDVGYGKTEVALRAAFKAAENGKQTAILVPTTILAMQHYQTMLSRFRGFPVSVDMLSRFRTPKEQEQSIRKLKRGETDVIVGTHRLLSEDVAFRDLGLLIVDEEQRFGVSHKEKLKKLAGNVDVLTLSATPIPRTMNMALSGIRDMSVLEEAPSDRLPVQSFVLENDDMIIGEAIKKELRRGGQVFYLCNNIEYMPTLAAKIAAHCPDARIETANGKMDKETLSDIWQAMVNGEIDILITTTIIETGVDVPNANTLIVDRADKLGLSQLHQIRGRVGRSSRRAYAYFTYPKGTALTEISQKRLEAIRDFTEFGAGFRIAMRDMEIRGAGNLLGADQHGHMEQIGYDLYMKILNEAVLEEKGEKPRQSVECTVEMNINAYLPENYVRNPNQRIDVYRKISLVETKEDAEDVYDELLDRYGDPPRPVLNILEISLIRALGGKCGFTKIERRENNVYLFPDQPDLRRLTLLASARKGKVLLNMGNRPYACIRCPKQEEMLDDTVIALTEYAATAQTDA